MIMRSLFTLFLFISLSLQAGVLPTRLQSEQSYLSSFIKDEQGRNDRVENTDVFSSITDEISLDYKYRPDSRSSFPLLVYLVPENEVVVYQTKKDADSFYKNSRGNKVRFFVHPASQTAFSPYLTHATIENDWQATATSSYRSILAWRSNHPEIYSLKVSLDVEIGEVSRMLSRAQIERATAVSYLLQETDKNKFAEQGIHFIDEPVSVFLKQYEYGYSIREMPFLPKGNKLVPLFSLYSKADGESLLQKQIDNQGLSAKQFVLSNLIRPLVEQTFYLGFEHGLIGAPHEQNILVLFKSGKMTSEFYYRDLGSFHINKSLRNLKHLSSDFVPDHFAEKNKPGTKLEIIENIQDYLLSSQFFALKRSLRPGQISDEWIQKETFKLVQEQILKYTGSHVSTWQAAKAAATRTANKGLAQQCRVFF
jgi:siderophore synthetase component